ncbi:MAG TPA: 16S rRNA (cytosine(967)-C(5))-methyltransferase RsmB [Verrucomicrobiae bacterium]|nr:16S rRNA (cytosine(967)-C(5))-methyltransferase RsmB [Verrucomicrobiae bacterium]
MNDKNPRQIAWRVLQQRNGGAGVSPANFTEDLLEREFSKSKLSPLDRALCQELVYGIVRRQSTLDWLIARKTNSREQKIALQNLLRLGLYQIFWLDKIPPHAAVHETVELAKQNGFGPQSGFVNAILRGYLREFDETKKILADLKISNPAIGFSHPQWLVEKWQKRFGDKKMRQLLEWNNTPPKTFARVNTLKTDAGKLIEKWRAENVEYDFVRRDWLPENLAFELKSHPSLNLLESFRDGWFYIQDPSTLLAPILLNPKSGETILDLCAAPGGKTTFLAQLMNNEGKIIACDISEERLKLVRENCERLGVTCVETFQTPHPGLLPVSRGEGEKSERVRQSSFAPPKRGEGGRRPDEGKFDKILVDAPCSNTGVMRRRVDLRWRISPEEISCLQKTQLDLLKLAATKLKPNGILIYSTCSLEPEENSEVVKEFLREHKNFKLESKRELLPFADNVDGAFIAKLSAQKS